MHRTVVFILTCFNILSALSQKGPGGIETISNTPFWYDGTQINQTSGTSVATWPNTGANVEDAVQASATNRPTYLTNQLNSQPVVSFDGVNDYLEIASNNDLDNNGPYAARTISLVFTTGADITTRQVVYEEGGGTRGLNVYIYNGNLYMAGWNQASDGAGAPWNFAAINTGIAASTSYIITYILNGNSTTTGTINGYLNSTSFGTIPNVGLLYNHNNAVLGGEDNGSHYETGSSSTDGKYFKGRIAEIVILNQAINDSDRIILDNYLAAKYNLSIGGNDYYTMDNAGNGHYDFEMAGVGRISASDLNSSAQGPSYIEISNATDLGNAEYILWGHDGNDDSYTANTSDVPSGENIYSRMNRSWRASVGGAPGTVDLSVFLDITCTAAFEPDNAVLLIDTDLDNNFNDETVAGGGVIVLTDVGNGEFQTTGLTLTNGSHFTIGFEINAPVSYTQVTGPGGIGDGTINRFWFNIESLDQTDNTRVNAWTNDGGATQNFTQSTANNQPTYRVNLQNGFSGLTFDGVNDYLVLANNNDINTGGPFSTRTFFVVFNTGTDITTRQVIYEEGGTGRGLNIYISAGSIYVGGWNLNTDGSDAPWGFSGTSSVIAANTTYVVTFEFNGNSCKTGNMSMYLNGTHIGSISNIGRLYAHTGAIGLGAMNGDTYFESGSSSGNGHYFEGTINELIIYNQVLFAPQRIIIENYLAAKYDLTLSSEQYVEDQAVNGDFDYQVAGIGRLNGIEYDADAQGTGVIRILNPGDLGDDEYLLWGHNNAAYSADNTSDVPPGVEARFVREWRFTETNSSGVSVDVGSVDIRWDLSDYPGSDASNLALLIDTNNDGSYADESPITGATHLGAEIFEFTGVTQISNGVRMTLGTTDATNTPLPISLLEFTATPADGAVNLLWKTASELNNDYFTIERSADGVVFHEILRVRGAGNSSQTLTYQIQDQQPLTGISYYRLKQTDYDGQYEYFEMVRVRFEQGDTDLLIYPNPTADFIHVNRAQEVRIYSLSGVEMTHQALVKSQGQQSVLDLRSFPAGYYLLNVGTTTKRIIKR